MKQSAKVDFVRVQSVFFEAMELPPSERAALLDSLGIDAATRDEVRALLAAANDDEFLNAPAAFPADFTTEEPQLVGRRIGPFTLGARIGVGGMGVVYEAEQDNPRRTVAIKLIRPELASADSIARFGREAALLGRLQHPGIATVFDAGAEIDPDDPDAPPRPYFAMELIRGTRITTWADTRALPLGDRIELLARVCDGVDHAHRRGVLHRDLKPANILVTDDGQPKILDFGVARALEPVASATVHTAAGDMVGTLGWMSPEQLRGRGSETDGRSDVYALGVIGYELFGGKPAFDLDGLSLSEAIRRLCDVEPTPLGRIRPDLPSDLTAVVGMAIMKDAAARYASAAAFAEDLRACRDQRPVIARAPTALYRASRFVRRNRTLVTVTTGAFVLLLSTAIVAASGWRRASVQADRSHRVNAYLLGAIGALNPSKLGGSQISLKQALDELSGQLGAELDGAPDLAADVHHALGQQYLEIGSLPEAESHFRAAMEARAIVFGEDAIETTDSTMTLAIVVRRQERPGEAVALLEPSIARLRARGAPPLELAEALNNLGSACYSVGRPADAIRYFEEGLAALDDSTGTQAGRAQLLGNLASVAMQSGDVKRGVECAKQAIALRVATEGESLETAKFVARWAGVMMHFGDAAARDDAIQFLANSVASLRRLLPADHDQLVEYRQNLALALLQTGRAADAADLALENADAMEAGGRARPEYFWRNLRIAANALQASHQMERRAEVLARLALDGQGPEDAKIPRNRTAPASEGNPVLEPVVEPDGE